MKPPNSSFCSSLPGSQTGASPLIHYFEAYEANASGHVLVIFPGGGYHGRADHEGSETAHWFATRGIASFVVDYKTAPEGGKHPSMLEDGLAAIHTVRKMAEEYSYNPNKLGVLGYSAGGHLAAHCLNGWDHLKTEIPLRPDYGILCYPVLHSQSPFAHEGSMRNLLGKENPTMEERREVDMVDMVSEKTPPTFLWHPMDDQAVSVENSLDFARKLRNQKIPFELHCYETGWHGIGLNTENPWYTAAVDFIRRR